MGQPSLEKVFRNIVARCPECKKNSTLSPVSQPDIVFNPDQYINMTIGTRRCPDPECYQLIFFVYKFDRLNSTGETTSFPHTRIDFDDTDIPESVKSAFNEALDCEAQECFVASAMMVRKTLEEMCHDQGANGRTLENRIESLKDKVLFPPEVFEALHDLRYLGNDAAHVFSNHFTVGPEEVNAGIILTREVLKAVYQFKKLKELLAPFKNPGTPPASTS